MGKGALSINDLNAYAEYQPGQKKKKERKNRETTLRFLSTPLAYTGGSRLSYTTATKTHLYHMPL
jgi:hypothetical protein